MAYFCLHGNPVHEGNCGYCIAGDERAIDVVDTDMLDFVQREKLVWTDEAIKKEERKATVEVVARSICRGEYEGEMDGKKLPGDFFDGTDGACPGWHRGVDRAYAKGKERIDYLEGVLQNIIDHGVSKQYPFETIWAQDLARRALNKPEIFNAKAKPESPVSD